MIVPIKLPRKLIEVALPLDDINEAAAREKSIRHGHPSTLHLWWARRPLAAARAVIFAQMVNDPGYQRELGRGVNKEDAERKREKLFEIIRDLVKWENTTNEEVLNRARAEIWNSWRETCELNKNHPDASTLFNPEKLPGFHDPFAGGGALPLEAQRLGLEAYASDLNPVAVMINKAMIEIPPKFANRKPIGPLPADEMTKMASLQEWKGAAGLAEDVRRYGAWMRKEAVKRIGHLYPQVDIKTGKPCIGAKGEEPATVIAWLWARTVKSSNPAFSDCFVPLVSSFWLSTKKGKEAYVKPIVEGKRWRFEVQSGIPENPEETGRGTKLARGANFRCVLSESPLSDKYIKEESLTGRMSAALMAIVADGQNGRIYLSPTKEMEQIAASAIPNWKPDFEMNRDTKDLVSGRGYGFFKWSDLFTSRQLTTLSTFSELVIEARDKIFVDACNAGMEIGDTLDAGGTNAKAYAEAVSVYLGFGVDKMSDSNSSLCRWKPTMDQSIATFGRQALPMVWDFSEANALGVWLAILMLPLII